MRRTRRRIPALALLRALCAVVGVVSLAGCHAPAEEKGTLVIFHAASLALPFRGVSALFEEQHPGVTVQTEAAESREAARKITELHQPCDIFAAADDQVTETLLMPRYADFNIRFAGDEMALAYTDRSRAAGEITDQNWWRVVAREQIRLARADPDRDACGARTLVMLQLAEKQYKSPGLAPQLEAKSKGRFLCPRETDALDMLEGAEVDYIFIYRSVCVQRELRYVRLPAEINLEASDFAPDQTAGGRGAGAGELVTPTGAPLVSSVTILKDARQREAAEAWVALLLSRDGQQILRDNGEMNIVPARTEQYDQLPALLRPLCVRGK
jgi:molybdate/tungstate transport system substrate-binding protein